MSDDPRRLTTEEQRDRLFTARHQGGLCAVCGRALAGAEPVYMDRFIFRQVGPSMLRIQAPVCRDCASPDILARVVGREPERCAGCGRGVFYPRTRGDRQRALCSRDCRNRAAAMARMRAKSGGAE